jgi:hypothetical protein
MCAEMRVQGSYLFRPAQCPERTVTIPSLEMARVQWIPCEGYDLDVAAPESFSETAQIVTPASCSGTNKSRVPYYRVADYPKRRLMPS